jgi:hypothetical protein
VAGGRGGANALSFEQHQLAGTLRRDRHSHLMPAARPGNVVPLAGIRRRRLLSGLGPAGRQLALDILADCGNWSGKDVALLREGAEAADRLGELRAAIRGEGGARVAPSRLLRAEHACSTRLAKLLDQLRLEGRQRGVANA